jgi:CcmD family protein
MMTFAMEPTPAPQASAPDDRATTFQPVEGGGEHRSGETLLVAAYSIIWTILMVWLVLLWKKQAGLNQRLEGLEGAILAASDKAAAAKASAAAPGAIPGADGASGKLGDQAS